MTSDVPVSQAAARFPDGFVWGVATAAYQVEGAAREGGRGPSIWDTFSHTPGRVRRGDTGDIACDAYHRLDTDLDLLSDLGVGAYRFSVSWPRVQPAGSGAVNQAGLDYYRRLVAGLRERGIQPVVTLYHWDLPQPLEDAGGWPARETAQRFADYAAIVARALGDSVAKWITLNEPAVVVSHGYRRGVHAPGRREPATAAAATHHLLLAHGLGLEALRAELPSGCEAGITLNLTPVRPADEDSGQLASEIDAAVNRLFLDPVITGSYPAGLPGRLLPAPGHIRAGDMRAISAPADFLGVNYYRPLTVRYRAGSERRYGERPLDDHPGVVSVIEDHVRRSALGWPIDASGLLELLVSLHRRAPGLPLLITENGMAAGDYVDPEGGVDDFERIDYLAAHLRAAAEAIDQGVDLRGYFCWSFLDNFEWAEGYQARFGLIFVDYGTQRRIPKASAAFYARVARTNSVPLAGGG